MTSASPAPAVAGLQLRLMLATALTLAFAFPNLAAWWWGADPLTIANESVGYRYLFSERLLRGEGASVWVLAGFLTTAIQSTWLAVINLFSEPVAAQLEWRLHLFSYGFSALVVALAGGILFAAARDRRLTLLDLALLAFPALGPVFATRSAGFYYYTLPDYYHLNVLLTLASTWLFLVEIRRPEPVARPGRHLFLLSFFVGAMCGNKITMLMIGLPLLVLPLFASPLSSRRFALRVLLCAAGGAAGFFFVIAWFYLFNLRAVLGMLNAWSTLVRNPGGEADFWTSNFRGFLTGYSYGYIIVFFLLTTLLALAAVWWHAAAQRVTRLLVGGTFLLGGVAWAYFVYKRPAGTTFFEAAVALFGFAAMALAVCSVARRGQRTALGFLALGAVYSALSFDARSNLGILRESRPWAENMWRLHRELLEFAQGHDVIAIHPQNHYGYGGVAEFLLKGTADVPSWEVTANGRPVLERYAPRLSYRHEYSGTHPNAPYPPDTVLFWVDRPEFPPLVDQYSLLGRAVAQSGGVSREWTMPIQGGRTVIRAHALKLPPAGAAPRAPELASPPADCVATRPRPDTAQITWRADGRCRVAVQVKTVDGEWLAAGRADETATSFILGELHPATGYVIRVRKELAGDNSAWLELTVPPSP